MHAPCLAIDLGVFCEWQLPDSHLARHQRLLGSLRLNICGPASHLLIDVKCDDFKIFLFQLHMKKHICLA